MTPIYMWDNYENDRVAFPKSVPIHLSNFWGLLVLIIYLTTSMNNLVIKYPLKIAKRTLYHTRVSPSPFLSVYAQWLRLHVMFLDIADKPGTCPRHIASMTTQCTENCDIDLDCPGVQKCCKSRCGAHCTDPCYYWLRPNQRSARKSVIWKLPFMCRYWKFSVI